MNLEAKSLFKVGTYLEHRKEKKNILTVSSAKRKLEIRPFFFFRATKSIMRWKAQNITFLYFFLKG